MKQELQSELAVTRDNLDARIRQAEEKVGELSQLFETKAVVESLSGSGGAFRE